MKEVAELMAMHGSVGGVEIRNDALGSDGVLLQEDVDEKLFHPAHGRDDLLVAAVGIRTDGSQFETVEGALAGEGLAAVAGLQPSLAERIGLADEHGKQRVEAQLIVIVEILVIQAQAEDALLDEFEQGVFDEIGIAMIGEAAGELFEEAELLFDFAEKQIFCIRGDLAAVEGSDNLT